MAVAFMSQREGGDRADEALARPAGFRRELYFCFGLRRDVLFEVCDAVLCKQERVLMLAEVSLEPECRRGHGAVYDALNCGQVRFAAPAGAVLVTGRSGVQEASARAVTSRFPPRLRALLGGRPRQSRRHR